MKRNRPTNRWWFQGSWWIDQTPPTDPDPKWHWWNEAESAMGADYKRFTWKGGEARAAFAYELARRSSKRLLRLPCYPGLTTREQCFVIDLFGVSECRWTSAIGDRIPEGYSAPCPRRWNLKETDKVLAKSFLAWIAAEREFHGVRRPSQRPTPSRPFSWRWVELLDSPHNLNDSERGILAKAKGLAKKHAKELREASRKPQSDLTSPRRLLLQNLPAHLQRSPLARIS